MGKMKMMHIMEMERAEEDGKSCCEICDKLIGEEEQHFDFYGGPYCGECRRRIEKDGDWHESGNHE